MSYIILRGHWCDVVLYVHAPTDDKIYGVKDSLYEELERIFDKFLKYHINIFLDFSAKVGRKDILKPTVGNKSVHEISNSKVRVVNFTKSKNLTLEITMFQHHIIHKFTWMSPDGKTHNQIDHILAGR
jgi:hypothetical protein